MNEKRKAFVMGMAVGFVLALVVLRVVMPAVRQSPPNPVVATMTDSTTENDMAHFFSAVEKGDFDGMRNTGSRIFTPGAILPDIAAMLAPYEVNGSPPYRVYAFMTDNAATTARRVLLTIDDQNRVESFLAEEMTVTP